MKRSHQMCYGLLAIVFVSRAFAADLPPCDPNDPTLLKPDLVSFPPSHARVIRGNGHRLLVFSSSPGNIGDGPLILHGHTIPGPDGPVSQATQEIWRKDGPPCGRVAGFFAYHPSHHHFHIQDFASYELRKDDPFTGPVVAASSKVSFCLLDIAQIQGFHTYPQVQEDCLNQEGTQGISVGYEDVYDFFLPDQDIDLDADPANPVPAGDYFLVNTVNSTGFLWEKNADPRANAGVISVRVNAFVGSPQGPHATEPPPTTPTGVSATPTGVSATPTGVPATATGVPAPPTVTPTPSSGGRGPRQPHAPHLPWNGPRPRHPLSPRSPHSPSH